MDDYHIGDTIGEGSFGKVVKTRKKQTGQIVAIKCISKKGKTLKHLRELRQEIRIQRQLNHENIILMLDSFETKTEFCVVMELAQGELYAILEKDEALPEAVVQSIAKRIVRALYYLHSNRVMHRDMKPQNILVAPDGVVKLCDFGFARVLSNSTQLMTSFKGTPIYMAPEVLQLRPYDHKADLWSFGVILYELFLGVPPFYNKDIPSLMKVVVQNPVKYPKHASTDFKNLLKGLLVKNPKDRFDWPQILEHPFIAESSEERAMRLHRAQLDVGRRRLEQFGQSKANNGTVQLQRKGNNITWQQYADLVQMGQTCLSDVGVKQILKDTNALRTLSTFLQSDEKKTRQQVLSVLHKLLDFLVKEEGEGYAKDFFDAGISHALVSSLIRKQDGK